MSKPIPARRAEKLFSLLDDAVDAIVVVNGRRPQIDDNFWYLTDVRGGVFEGSFAIARRGGVTILTAELEETVARRSDCRVMTARSVREIESSLRRIMRGVRVLGVNAPGISWSGTKNLRRILKGVKIRDVSKALSDARITKDRDELTRIGRAAKIASRVADELPDILHMGITEREAAAKIDYALKSHGADESAFETIAAFGPASAIPHYRSGKRKLRRGSVALFDFGALYRNYRSDISRTFLTKPVDRRFSEVYDVVLAAHEAAVAEIRPGRKARAVDAAARKVIRDSGYGDRFIHATGHGLGISEHDPGVLSAKSKEVLGENMVFTIEPGIYLRGRGGVRIEDDIVVTPRGARLLTTSPRELILI